MPSIFRATAVTLVLDVPTTLPEGTEVELQVVPDVWAGMDAGERAELEASIEEGARDFERGDYVEARAFMAQLRAKQP